MKCYKLNKLYPWWCNNFKSQFPVDHIETIVDGLSEIYGTELWESLDYKNLDWKTEQEIWMVGLYESLPDYIKVEKGNGIYYYYLYSRNEIVSESAKGIIYRGKYIIDSYMTKYQAKLQCLINANPVVKFNHKYCDRFQKDSNDNWFVDFVAQKYLSSYIPQNSEKIRTLAYSTSESELYSNNFSDYEKPATRTLTNYADSSKTWEISNFSTLLSTPSNTGRYRYMVCKSSAKISTNNSSIQPVATSQSILLIPLWDDSVLHAINDINTTETQTGALSPLGDNFIGFWESDLPYSFIYGMEKSDSSKITMHFATNTCFGTTTSGNIPFWTIPLNYYKRFKLIDFSQYSSGFGGKMTYMIENLDKWNPETEPALYAPQNYQEVYNNGAGNITNDLSYFIYKWTGASIDNLKKYRENGAIPNDDPAFISMYACFGFDSALNIAYDFGDFTNTKLASYDNTEVITSSVSIANQIAGSAAANYYSSNVNTGLTSVQNRHSEQTQAYIDAALNTAKNVNNAAPNGFGEMVLKPGSVVKRAINSVLDTAKLWVDTGMSQQRANKELFSQVNNLYSSPASIIGNPYLKGIIPNNNQLFKTYAYELHDYDKKKVFGDILEYGRIYDTLDSFNAFNNNNYMNILDITPTTTYYRLLRIVLENDNSIFNTPADNDEFFVWLGQPHQMFNVWFPINCINYEADDYIDNIEKTVYPFAKTNINNVITNLPTAIKAESSLLIAELKELNPSAPESVWSDIEIIRADYNYLSIKAKSDSETYYGSIVTPCICYNAKVVIDEVTEYVYDFNKVFATYSTSNYKFESGTYVNKLTFNSAIEFNSLSSITEINDWFLSDAFAYDNDIVLPSNITKIGKCFLQLEAGATSYAFNSNITLPSSLTYLGRYFLQNCTKFNNSIELPSTLEFVGNGFMINCSNMCSTISLGDLEATVFEQDGTLWGSTTLTVLQQSTPAYTNGVIIAGTNASAFKERFPNLTSGRVYRKLV